MKGEMVSVLQDRVPPAVEMSRPIEVLIPAARERTRRRRTIIGLFITLALCATVFLLASSVRNVGPKPSATTSGAARQAAALGPACTLGNDITLESKFTRE
jgi:hypothetical protein